MATILDEGALNVPLAAFHVRSLACLRLADPKAAIDLLLQPLLPGPYLSVFRPATALRPGFFYGGNQQRKVVYFDGCTTASQAVSLVNGYDNVSVAGAFSGRNGYLDACAQDAFTHMSAAGIGDPEHLDLVGYSLGGAIATVMMERLSVIQSVLKRKLITFGSPRALCTNPGTALATAQIGRWMADADPIPLIPPRVYEAPTIVAQQNPLTIIRWGNYAHTLGGMVVQADGSTFASHVPTSVAIDASLNLGLWYFSLDGGLNGPHSLNNYFASLSAAAAQVATPAQQNLEGETREQGQNEKQKTVSRRQREVETAINLAGNAQNANTVYVPPDRIFDTLRLGRIWYVTFGGEIVITAPIEKRARHIARAGNDFLRSLPKQALVDPVGLLQMMEQFLVASAAPESGFSPQIRTSLNV